MTTIATQRRLFIHCLINFAALLLFCGCNDDQPTSGANKTFDSSAERVGKMAEGCPEVGDYQGESRIAGSFILTQEALPWFRMPRQDNPIQKALKWDDAATPIGSPLAITSDKTSIIVKLPLQGKEQEFKGNIFQDQRLCFTGPVTLDVEGLSASANLFAEGKLTAATDKTPLKLDLTVTLGISADNAAAEKDKKQLKRFEMLGTFKVVATQQDPKKQTTQKNSGLFLQIGSGDDAETTIYVNDEISVAMADDSGGYYLNVSKRYQRYGEQKELPSKIKLPLPSHSTAAAEVELELTYPSELPHTLLCNVKTEKNGSDLKGSLSCVADEEQAAVQGQFYILNGAALQTTETI